MKNPALILLLFLVACSGQKENTTADVAIDQTTPDFALDSLLMYASEAALIDHFGASNVTRDTVWLPEGMGQIMVTLLYPGTRNQVQFEWADSAGYRDIDAIE